MPVMIPDVQSVVDAEPVIHRHVSPAPLIRSCRLERELGLPPGRRVWLKDYGWTPVGSFKLLGALNWVANNSDRIGNRPIVAHSSGNFASGIAFAGRQYGKRVIVVMPDTAPQVKFALTQGFGAETRTYDITRDHETGDRDRMTHELVASEGAVRASPYDDPFVIAGNGVGGLEITAALTDDDRTLSSFICPVSGGGLMAGHALAVAAAFPDARITGVEPEHADDFRQSLAAGERVRIDHPHSICDGLLSYDVGEHNWPILRSHVAESIGIPDDDTRQAMAWLYEHHGLRTEPSGAIAVAGLLTGRISLEGSGDVVAVISGRNVDERAFRDWTP